LYSQTMSMSLHIHSTAAISPLDTYATGSIGGAEAVEALREDVPYFTCVHPDYKQILNPAALRRMSPVIRMGLASALACLERSGIKMPGAVLVGSGLGCVKDTVRFLDQVTGQQEQLLNPTAFIQSTHNTVSGQIALTLGCRALNLTFTQKSLSFESALLEAIMLSAEDHERDILLGGVDEITQESHRLMVEAGCMKPGLEPDLLNSPTPGSAAGEGAAFFLVSGRSRHAGPGITDLQVEHSCPAGEIGEAVGRFLERNHLRTQNVDMLVTGRGGDAGLRDRFLEAEVLFPESHIAAYKHVTGDYDTATAMGLYLAVLMMETGRVATPLRVRTGNREKLERVLHLNVTREGDLSLVLLSAGSGNI